MKIISIEPTPSPYSMKINVDETLADMQTETYKRDDDLSSAPQYVHQLFNVEGVKELYRVIDFIALERDPKVEWESILPKVKEVLGAADTPSESTDQHSQSEEDPYGEVKVFIQMFRGIPMQVKLEENEEEKRFGLSQRFADAAMEASKESTNMLMERKWVEQDPRYGDPNDIGQDIVDEIEATYDEKRLNTLVKLATSDQQADASQAKVLEPLTEDKLQQDDWKARYAALDRMPDPTIEDLPLLGQALDDPKMSIRRLATAYLGMVEDRQTLPYLYKALEDKTVTVRRTAGDCLSDLGFTEAIPKMVKGLEDRSRIIRWRAAMFLYEYGDQTAIPALEKALNDPEFEVRMQAKMALSRIQEGEAAQGSIWKQMTEMTKMKKDQ
ncbi:conserved virulence factor C family protein [Alkalibacillus haloalkaliphilus]|uniref:conserved virulence factor C family protein n=1 Tax=Alkalibacillus haloalkaliphilus TaxID=94136 RepID=UPI0029362E77|nr:conserved virulence factor C family protein [Alkalibacillus haloalkaliphilus]MDV2581983.1 conserved virulence factor C family protein [Alkalibacillus haloalkaliphilus]